MILFDDALCISINGRASKEYSYYADANSENGAISTDIIGYKDGYIEELIYMNGYKISVIKGTYVAENGQKQDIYFVASPFNADLDINLSISLEEDLLAALF